MNIVLRCMMYGSLPKVAVCEEVKTGRKILGYFDSLEDALTWMGRQNIQNWVDALLTSTGKA